MGRQTKLTQPAALPAPPARMSAACRELWNETISARPASAWSAADLPLLELYCRTVVDIRRLDKVIQREGETLTTVHGNVVIHPCVTVRAMRERQFIQVATKLKLTPSGRYTSKDAERLRQHGAKAARTAAALDDDGDGLLAGSTARSLQ